MKFVGLYGETPKKKDEFYLKLELNANGNPQVIAVDSEGKHIKNGCICVIASGDLLITTTDLNPELGYRRDEFGSIKVY